MGLEKMIVILLDNAVKYTLKGGRIVVSADTVRKSLVIKVKDTGVGISKKDLPHIFDRFYRADQSRSKEILMQSLPGYVREKLKPKKLNASPII
jgi:signal transduction histidine kinase